MRGIISNSKAELDTLNKKINDFMYSTIPNYNAKKFGDVVKHQTLNKYVLVFENDRRMPVNILSTLEKSKHVNLKRSDWFKPPMREHLQ